MLTVRFDTQGLEAASSPWVRLVGSSPQILRLAITVGVVFLLLNAKRLWDARSARATLSPRARLGWLAIHFFALIQFVQISNRIFSHTLEGWTAALWVSAWFAAAATMLVSWLLVFVARQPAALSARANRTLAGAAIGLGALSWAGGFLTEELWRRNAPKPTIH